ncbi:MAG: zinc metalloprotease HtpX [Burkholderiales bacterium]
MYRLVALLAQRAGLARTPRLYRVPAPVLNAFAAGSHENPAIALTDGLLAGLEPREMAGVLAHELSHVRAHDVWVMTLAAVVARMTSLMSFAGRMLLFILIPVWLFTGRGMPLAAIALLLFAPAISSLLQLALSRTREYDADAAAVELTGDPGGLASALAKLERQRAGWMQRIFMARAPGWLLTHPSTTERIRRLMEIEREHALA